MPCRGLGCFNGLPLGEATKVVFPSRAHLIGETEIIFPAFLLGAPPAAPREFEAVNGLCGIHVDNTREVRTT